MIALSSVDTSGAAASGGPSAPVSASCMAIPGMSESITVPDSAASGAAASTGVTSGAVCCSARSFLSRFAMRSLSLSVRRRRSPCLPLDP